MSTGASKEKQTTDSKQVGGGNLVGKAPSAPIIKPDTFSSKGFTPDNQTTSRGKGKA